MSHIGYAVSGEVSFDLLFEVTAAYSRNHVDQQVFKDLRSRLAPNLTKYDLKSFKHFEYLLHVKWFGFQLLLACYQQDRVIRHAHVNLHPSCHLMGSACICSATSMVWKLFRSAQFSDQQKQSHCWLTPMCTPHCLRLSITQGYSSKCCICPATNF